MRRLFKSTAYPMQTAFTTQLCKLQLTPLGSGSNSYSKPFVKKMPAHPYKFSLGPPPLWNRTGIESNSIHTPCTGLVVASPTGCRRMAPCPGLRCRSRPSAMLPSALVAGSRATHRWLEPPPHLSASSTKPPPCLSVASTMPPPCLSTSSTKSPP
jgi:hypothetical protein